MVFVRRLVALLLLALWLPATLHCTLEMAGLDDLFHCADGHDADAEASHDDACDVVETGFYKPATNTATLPPPALSLCALSFVFPEPALPLLPPASGISEADTAPPEVARTWHFVARAAPPARAPSLAS